MYDKAEVEQMVEKAKAYDKEKDYEKAVYWYRKAAEQGDGNAQYILAKMYYRGRGVEKNPAKAMLLLLQAAEAGCTSAMNVLGVWYSGCKKGEREFPTNKAVAIAYFEQAVKMGDESCRDSLAKLKSGQQLDDDDTRIAWFF